MRISHQGWAGIDGLWLAVLYAVAAAGLWFGREWARRMSMALALLPAAVIPMVVLALRAPHRVFESRWELVMAGGGIAALVLLRAAGPPDGIRPERRHVPAALTAFGIEVAILAVTGVAGDPLAEPVLNVTQLPGAWIVHAMGYCCGWGVVITDYAVSRWGTIMPAGLPILAVANTVGILPLVVLARRIRRPTGRRGAEAPAVAV
jgi:hypothetical protein